MNIRVFGCALIATLTIGTHATNASTLYGSDYGGGVGPAIYEIDHATASNVQVAFNNTSDGDDTAAGLAYNPLDGRLYAISASFEIRSYDLSDFSSQLVRAGGGEDAENMTGLAFSPDYTKLYTLTQANPQLVTYDLGSGVTTTVGGLGVANYFTDLAINSTGVLYAADVYDDALWTVDRSTGVATPVKTFAVSFTSIAFDENDSLWGVTLGNDSLYSGLLTENPTLIAQLFPRRFDIRGLEFTSPVIVPEPAAWAFLIAGFGVTLCARRRAAIRP